MTSVSWPAGCFALFSLVDGTDAAAEERRQQVAAAGAIPLLVAALRFNLDHAEVQKYACAALSHLVLRSTYHGTTLPMPMAVLSPCPPPLRLTAKTYR